MKLKFEPHCRLLHWLEVHTVQHQKHKPPLLSNHVLTILNPKPETRNPNADLATATVDGVGVEHHVLDLAHHAAHVLLGQDTLLRRVIAPIRV